LNSLSVFDACTCEAAASANFLHAPCNGSWIPSSVSEVLERNLQRRFLLSGSDSGASDAALGVRAARAGVGTDYVDWDSTLPFSNDAAGSDEPLAVSVPVPARPRRNPRRIR